MKKSKKATTSDAVEILNRRYVHGNARKLAELEAIRAEDAKALQRAMR